MFVFFYNYTINYNAISLENTAVQHRGRPDAGALCVLGINTTRCTSQSLRLHESFWGPAIDLFV